MMSDPSSFSNKWEPKIDLSKGIESPIEILNKDVFFDILSFLNFADRMRIERVSHKWRHLSQQSWCRVTKFDFSYETWGTLPIHNYVFIFCPKILEKVLTLCTNTLTHCNFSFNEQVQCDYQGYSIELSKKVLSKFATSCRNLKWLKVSDSPWLHFPILSLKNLRTKKLEEFHAVFLSHDEVEIANYRKILRMIFQKSPRLHTINIHNLGMKFVPQDLKLIINKELFKSSILDEYLRKFKNLERCEVILI